MRVFFFIAGCVVAVSVAGCRNNNANPGAPTAAGETTAAPSILGERGAQSFSPNPASVGQGQLVTWHNTDEETHHIVLNDGSLDTGDIGPGATSAPLRFPSNGANYHCTITDQDSPTMETRGICQATRRST